MGRGGGGELSQSSEARDTLVFQSLSQLSRNPESTRQRDTRDFQSSLRSVLALPRHDGLIVASKALFIAREIEGKITVEGVLVFLI